MITKNKPANNSPLIFLGIICGLYIAVREAKLSHDCAFEIKGVDSKTIYKANNIIKRFTAKVDSYNNRIEANEKKVTTKHYIIQDLSKVSVYADKVSDASEIRKNTILTYQNRKTPLWGINGIGRKTLIQISIIIDGELKNRFIKLFEEMEALQNELVSEIFSCAKYIVSDQIKNSDEISE